MKAKFILITLSILLLLFTAQGIYANDLEGNTTLTLDEDLIVEETREEVLSSQNEDVLTTAPGTFTELDNLIKSSDVVSLSKNYTFSSGDRVINIDKPVTINGNGYTIDAAKNNRVFDIKSTNVILNNITFVNGKSASLGSLIFWNANNGVIANSTFKDSTSNAHGFVYITGNNFIIDNNVFVNGSSKSSYGIYFNGNNSRITNNFFGNSSGKLGTSITVDGSHNLLDNNCFANIYSTEDYSSGIQIAFFNGNNRYNNTISNSRFVNCIANMSVINIQDKAIDTRIFNCTFINSITTRISQSVAGAISSYGKSTQIIDCDFTNSIGVIGGAIYLGTGNDHIVKNIFINGSRANYGGAIAAYCNNITLNNVTIINGTAKIGGGIYYQGYNSELRNFTIVKCYATDSAGGLFVNYRNNTVKDAIIKDNKAGYYGGAIQLSYNADDNTLDNCTLINNSVSYYGGGVYVLGKNNTLKKSVLQSNLATYYGGAIYIANEYNTVHNSILTGNRAYYGGGIYITTKGYNTVDNCTLNSNVASYYGGGIYIISDNNIVNNSYLESNYATHSGGILAYGNNIIIDHSNFTKNFANYGGGAISNVGYNTEILNSKFDFNRVNNYGGALSVTDAYVENCIFNDNTAIFGGAIYTINSTIKDSQFNDGNKAAELGSKVFAIKKAEIINSNVEGDELYDNNSTDVYSVTGTNYMNMNTVFDGEVISMTTSEYYLLPVSTTTPTSYNAILDKSFKLLRNRFDSYDVSEIAKIVLYTSIYEYKYDIWSVYRLADTNDYLTNGYDYVKNAIEAFNNGYRVPDFEYENGILKVNEFYSLITPTIYKNLFFYKQKQYPLNFTVTKTLLNEGIVVVGDVVKFQINITNNGEYKLDNISFAELFDSSQLDYIDYTSTASWIFNKTSKTWKLDSSLNVNDTVSLIVSFKALTNGTFVNTVNASYDGKINRTANDTVRVYNPDMNITKIALTRVVPEFEQAIFEIVVKNTGDMDLSNVVLIEDKYDGLTYAGYHETTAWTYAYVNDKHTWKLNENLAAGDENILYVIFNTTMVGTFTNNVIVNSNEVQNKKANDTVRVLKHNFTVTKVALTNVTEVGDQTVFEIVVHNTGDVDLHGVFIIEDPEEGLIFDHVRQATRWTQSKTSDGKLKWTFNEVLPSEEWVFMFMVFNTTKTGNFTNTVIAGSIDTVNKTANATVWVNDTVHKPEGNIHDLEITLTAIHPLVLIGNQVMFEIVIHNTGNTILHNVTVSENLFDGLVFDHFIDYNSYWEPIFAPKLSNGLLGAPLFREYSWQMNDILYVGEYNGFFVVFNTTSTGVFSNSVLGSSDETDAKLAEDTVEVVKPQYVIEKHLINTNEVYTGDEIQFRIVVINTGNVNLTNLVVNELPEDGLEFLYFIDDNGMWIQNSNSMSFDRNVFPEEQVEFIAVFKANDAGTYTNRVVSSADLDDDKEASANVRVLSPAPKPDINIDSRVIDTPVYIGNTSQVEITVTNTGNDELEGVYVKLDLNTGLAYLSYANGSRNWTNSGDTFYLSGSLKVGASATFTILVNTSKLGNLSSSASAGANGNVSDNTTFVIEVLGNNTDIISKPIIEPPVDPIDPESSNDPISDDDSSKQVSAQVDKNATGNPLLVLLVVLLNLIIVSRRRK